MRQKDKALLKSNTITSKQRKKTDKKKTEESKAEIISKFKWKAYTLIFSLCAKETILKIKNKMWSDYRGVFLFLIYPLKFGT